MLLFAAVLTWARVRVGAELGTITVPKRGLRSFPLPQGVLRPLQRAPQANRDSPTYPSNPMVPVPTQLHPESPKHPLRSKKPMGHSRKPFHRSPRSRVEACCETWLFFAVALEEQASPCLALSCSPTLWARQLQVPQGSWLLH